MLESEAAGARVVSIGPLSSNVDRYWTPVQQHDPGPQEVHHHIRRSLTQNLVTKRPASGKKNLVISWTWLWPTPMSHPNWKWTWCKFSPLKFGWATLSRTVTVDPCRTRKQTCQTYKTSTQATKNEQQTGKDFITITVHSFTNTIQFTTSLQCELTTSLPKPTLILDKGAGQGRAVSSPYTDLLRWGREA